MIGSSDPNIPIIHMRQSENKLRDQMKMQSLKNFKIFQQTFFSIIFPCALDGISQLTKQGMVDGSASKPALRQDTRYMVEKTYLDIAPYLGAFGAYLMPQ